MVFLGFQCSCEEAVAQGGFVGRHATGEMLDRLAVGEFVQECGPHLQDRIGKPELENFASNRLERRLVTGLDLSPGLFTAGVFQDFQDIGVDA